MKKTLVMAICAALLFSGCSGDNGTVSSDIDVAQLSETVSLTSSSETAMDSETPASTTSVVSKTELTEQSYVTATTTAEITTPAETVEVYTEYDKNGNLYPIYCEEKLTITKINELSSDFIDSLEKYNIPIDVKTFEEYDEVAECAESKESGAFLENLRAHNYVQHTIDKLYIESDEADWLVCVSYHFYNDIDMYSFYHELYLVKDGKALNEPLCVEGSLDVRGTSFLTNNKQIMFVTMDKAYRIDIAERTLTEVFKATDCRHLELCDINKDYCLFGFIKLYLYDINSGETKDTELGWESTAGPFARLEGDSIYWSMGGMDIDIYDIKTGELHKAPNIPSIEALLKNSTYVENDYYKVEITQFRDNPNYSESIKATDKQSGKETVYSLCGLPNSTNYGLSRACKYHLIDSHLTIDGSGETIVINLDKGTYFLAEALTMKYADNTAPNAFINYNDDYAFSVSFE